MFQVVEGSSAGGDHSPEIQGASEVQSVTPISETKRQIDQFGGPSRFGKDFVLLSEIKTLPGTALRGETLRKAIWNALPNSRIKIFQQAFSNEDQLVVPVPQVTGGVIGFQKSKDEIRELSVQATVVDPEKISDGLRSSLGLAEGGVGIQQLKLAFDAAHSFARTQLRMLAMEPPSQSLRAQHERFSDGPIPALPSETNGTVLLTREKSGKPSGFLKERIVAHYEGVYAAHRKTLHQSARYTAETMQIGGVVAELDRFAETLRTGWKEAPEDLRDIFRDDTKRYAQMGREAVKGCSQEYKVNARDILTSIHGIEDDLGRANPRATVLKVKAALKRLDSRVGDIRRKSPSNSIDRRLLEDRMGRAEALMKGFRVRLEERAGVLLNPRTAQRLENPTDSTVRNVMLTLGIHPEQDFTLVRMRPSRTFAKAIREEVGELQSALENRDLPAAKQCARHMQILTKLHAAAIGIEHLKQHARTSDEVPLEATTKLARSLNQVLLSPRLFPEVTASSRYVPLQNKLGGTVQKVDAMARRLQDYSRQDLSPDDKASMRERFNKFLDSFDIEEQVLKLF
ncbi:MAG: hypothetical protein KDD70_02135 [Bdellovibrionales bacterium]|nr:hypothetical protein [Bdellovibrionales bacterium]